MASNLKDIGTIGENAKVSSYRASQTAVNILIRFRQANFLLNNHSKVYDTQTNLKTTN